MKKIIAFLPVLFIASGCFNKGFCQVSGKILDADNKPLSLFTISLLKQKDSSVVKLFLTDKEGGYIIDYRIEGTYLLQVQHRSYRTYWSQPFIIKNNSPVQLAAVQMIPVATTLANVTVGSKKPLVERKADRTIINVDAFISNAGSNALEILERSPGVQVDNNDAISLKGKPGVLIYIDDKPTYLSGSDLASYLKSLPAGMLDKIEIMTTPPAKYDAAGNSGIINIKTKKTRIKGFNGSFNSSYRQGVYGDSRNTVIFNYRNNKFNFFGNIAFSKGMSFNDLTINRWYTDVNGNIESGFTQNSYIKRSYHSFNTKIGLDYSPNKKTTLGIVFNSSGRPSTETRTNKGIFFNVQQMADSIIIADNYEKERFKNSSINFNYRYQFDSSGKEISADADYIKYTTTNDQLFKNSSYTADNNLRSRDNLIGSLPADLDIYSFKTDFTWPLNKRSKLETGIKASYIATDNIASYFTSVNNITTPDLDKTNHFIYKENISAAYLNYNIEQKRWTFQLGFRAENTISRGHQLGNSVKPDSAFKKQYVNLFPTIFLSYKLDSAGDHQLNLAYSKRIDRPYYADLNPFISPLDKFTYYAGNPFLNPQFTRHIELVHSYKNIINTTLFYDRTRDEMNETIELSGNIFISRTGNIGKKDAAGISIDATLKPAKWWTILPYALYYHLHTKSKVYTEDVDTKGSFWMGTILNQFTLTKGWSVELFGRYRSDNIDGQFKGLHWGQLNMGAQKKVFHNKASLKVNFLDVFRTRINAGKISSLKGGSSDYLNLSDSRAIVIAFTYNFSKGAKSQQLNKDGSAAAEQGRVKQ